MVERYDFDFVDGEVPIMERSAIGEYVLYSDYADLEKQNEELRAAISGKPMDPSVTHGQYLEMAHTLNAACDGGRDRAEAAERQLAEVRAERDEARKVANFGCDANGGGSHTIIKQGNYAFCAGCGETVKHPPLSERCRKAEAERDRLSAENEALKRMAFWFAKYPEFKPNPEMIDEVCADIELARPFIPSARAALDTAKGAEK